MSLVRKSYSLTADKSFEIYIFVDEEGAPWFKAKEVAFVLGYSDSDKAIRMHVESGDKLQWNEVPTKMRGLKTPSNWQPKTIFINESGLYDLVWHSKMPFAREFKRWVKCEVLPSIRKTGAYVSPDINQQQISTLLDMLKQKDAQLTEDRQMLKHKDAQLAEDRQIMAEDRKHILSLMNKIVEDRPKIAVMPDTEGCKHELRVYQHKNRYKCIRTQKRYMSRAIQNIPRDYALALRRENVPNAVSPLNKIKELIPRCEYTAKNNEIETKRDVVNLLEKLLYTVAPLQQPQPLSPPPPPTYDESICNN
nr:bro-d [Calliteara abietis nucleopolyhedrovirus]